MIGVGFILQGAMHRSDRFIRASLRVHLQQPRQASLVKIAHRTFAIRPDPFRMLGAEIVVNLKLKRTERVSRARADNLPSQGYTRANHSELDNRRRKIVQIDLLKLRAEHGGRSKIDRLKTILWDTIAAEITCENAQQGAGKRSGWPQRSPSRNQPSSEAFRNIWPAT